jgi:hypothetical protein
VFGSENKVVGVVKFDIIGMARAVLLRPLHELLHVIHAHGLSMVPGRRSCGIALDSFGDLVIAVCTTILVAATKRL